MIFGRHNGVLAPVLRIPACKRENALLFGKGCGNLVSGSATRESILPRRLRGGRAEGGGEPAACLARIMEIQYGGDVTDCQGGQKRTRFHPMGSCIQLASGGVSATVGWLVGWVENDRAQTVFALNLEIGEQRHIASRMKLAQQLLSDIGAT